MSRYQKKGEGMSEVMVSGNVIIFGDKLHEFAEVEGLSDGLAHGGGVQDHGREVGDFRDGVAKDGEVDLI
jgi:hypothetical protein